MAEFSIMLTGSELMALQLHHPEIQFTCEHASECSTHRVYIQLSDLPAVWDACEKLERENYDDD